MADDTPIPIADTGPTEEQQAEAEALAAKMKPLVDLVQSDAFAEVLDGLNSMHSAFINDQIGYAHLYGVMSTMPRLKVWAESQ